MWSSNRILPSLTIIATSVAVNALLLEPISNKVWSFTGVLSLTDSVPNPLVYSTESLRTIATDTAGIFHVCTAFAIYASSPGNGSCAEATADTASLSANAPPPPPPPHPPTRLPTKQLLKITITILHNQQSNQLKQLLHTLLTLIIQPIQKLKHQTH